MHIHICTHMYTLMHTSILYNIIADRMLTWAGPSPAAVPGLGPGPDRTGQPRGRAQGPGREHVSILLAEYVCIYMYGYLYMYNIYVYEYV